MTLIYGDKECSTGLSKILHDFMIKPKESKGMGAEDTIKIPKIDPNTGEDTGELEREEDSLLKRYCYNLSKIILEYIKENIEIQNIEVDIKDVSTEVSVRIGDHTYTGTGSGTATGKQSNSGTGQVK